MTSSKIRYLVLVLAVLCLQQAIADVYRIDTQGAHAFVRFKASHLGYSYIYGRFNSFSGQFEYDTDNPSSASVQVVIDAQSIDSNHAERDRKLRSADFFDVEAFPEITFSSTAVTESGVDEITIEGNLTLRGITRTVTLEGNHIGHGKDPWGGYRRGLEASVMLYAGDYGLPSWIGDVQVDLVVEGIR